MLHFCEPGAPKFDERLRSLRHTFEASYKTSVSCEPFLDEDIINLYYRIQPFITDSIWIGKMNKIKQRVDTRGWGKKEYVYLERVKKCQTDVYVIWIFRAMRNCRSLSGRIVSKELLVYLWPRKWRWIFKKSYEKVLISHDL